MILMKRARVPGISLDVNFFIFIYVDQIKNCCGNTGGKDNSSLAISLSKYAVGKAWVSAVLLRKKNRINLPYLVNSVADSDPSRSDYWLKTITKVGA